MQSEIDALLAQATALAEEPAPTGRAGPATPAPAGPREAGPRAAGKQSNRPVDAEDPERILRLKVPVIVRLAERTMPLAEIVSMTTGAILEFSKPVDADLDLMINNKCIARGQPVKVGENFGLRITSIGSVRDRIEALGPK